MFRGKLFHSVGAAAAKDLLPKYSNRHLGGVSRWFSVDRRVRFGEYGISSSRIYAGASPFKALYVSKRILKSILCFTGSQCRSTRTGVMWSYLRHLVMTRAAWFWRFWSWNMSSLGIPNIRLLQSSSLDVIVAFTNFSTVGRSRYFRILPMEYKLKLIDLHTLEMWSFRLHVESKITPRFLGGSSLGLISWSPTLMEICKDWLVLGRDVITNSSVLSSFSFNKFNFIHARISSTHFSRREMLLTMDEGSEGLNAK